jgi:hypothetical protein
MNNITTEAQQMQALRAEYRAQVIAETIDAIRGAYQSLRAEPGAWVSLTRLRARLADIARADLDTALLEMVLEPGVMLDPEFNQKTLTPADRAAALRMGGENCHVLAIGRH